MGVWVGVSVGGGVEVVVSVGMGVNVSVRGMRVAVESGTGEEEAGGCSPPQAAKINVKIRRYGKTLFFMR